MEASRRERRWLGKEQMPTIPQETRFCVIIPVIDVICFVDSLPIDYAFTVRVKARNSIAEEANNGLRSERLHKC
jgi:hypothetical protein